MWAPTGVMRALQEARDAAAGGGMLNGRWRLQREKRQRKATDGVLCV